MYQNIIVEKRGDGVAKITINRPQVLNALNSQTRKELAEAFRDCQKDPSVKVVIITGAGERAFTAGQDLAEAQEFDGPRAEQWIVEFDQLYSAMRDLEKPLISAVNGVATGAGLQVAIIPDIVVAADTARFGSAEINVGIPCITGSGLMWPLLSRNQVAEIIMTARLLSAAEADKWGLVNRVVPAAQLMETVEELASLLASKPQLANSLNKRWLKKLTQAHYEETIKYASYAHHMAYASGEPQKIMRAFFEERQRRKQQQ